MSVQIRMILASDGLAALVMPDAVPYWESRGWTVDPDTPVPTPDPYPQYVTTAEASAVVSAAVAALVASAPAALDTLNELASALGDDAAFATTVTNALAGKAAKASNLADLGSPSAARTNLGLAVLAASGRLADATDLSTAYLAVLAANPDNLIVGSIMRDSNGAATSAPVVWPDGTVGTYTADTVSSAFPGAVDAYHITYGSPATKTYTQPAVTRDASGAVTARPAVTVA